MVKRGVTPQQARKIRAEKGMKETKLQKLRVKRNLSQSELAEMTGISIRTLQCYEQQARPIDGARLKTLCDLSNVLGCKIEDILESKELINEYKLVK